VLVLANVALGVGLVNLMCGVDDVYTVSSDIIDLLYNFSCYVSKLLHVRYKDDWEKVCHCWFEFITSSLLASILWGILQ
jgi:hypothetical protein